MAERELIYRLKVDTKTGKLALSQFQNDLEATTKTAESGAKRIKTAFDNTSKTLSDVGKGLTVGVTVPLVAMAAAALKAGQDFDNAFDGIRVATGATGKELEGLQDSFRKVFENVPDSADKVSAAIGELNTRLGLSGPPLESLTTQILNLSRLTGEDLNTVIEASTRAFGAWDIAAAEQGKTLDFLFKVSQQTGVGMGALLQKVTQFAPVFREMGFSVEESAALLGKWEKAGVNAEIVLSGLRTATQKFTDVGISLRDGLTATIKKIQELGPSTKATALAVDTFGKAGVTMADAILKGRLSIDDLMKSLKDSPETINGAAKATEGFAEKFDILKNRVLSALEPLGTELLSVLETDVVPAMMSVIEAIKSMVKWFSDLPGSVKTAVIGFAAFAAVLGPLLIAMGSIVSWAGNIAVTMAQLAPKLIAVTGATTALEAVLGILLKTLIFAAQAVAVVAVAFLAWEFGKWIASATGLDEAFVDLGQSLIRLSEKSQAGHVAVNALTFGFLTGDNSAKLLQATTEKLNKTLDTPLIKQASESWADYADRVAKAAFAQTGIAGQLQQINIEALKLGSSLGVTLSGALKDTAKQHSVLVAQLKEQKAPQADIERATLAANAAWDKYKKSVKEVNIELPDFSGKADDAAKAAEKAAKEIEGWGNALGIALPKLKQTVTDGEKYIAYLKKNKASALEVAEAEKKLLEAKKKLVDELNPAQAAFRKINDTLKDNITAFERAEAAVKDYKVEMVSMRGLLPDVTEMQLDHGTAMAEAARKAQLLEAAQEALEGAFKHFGLTTREELERLADVADAKFRMIRDSGIASPKQILIAQKQAIEAIIRVYEELGQKVPPEFAKMVQSIDKELAKLPKSAKERAQEMSKDIRQEISTIFNDLEKGIAEAIVHWKGFGETLKSIAQNFAESILRIFLKNLLDPLTKKDGPIDKISSAMSEQFEKLGKKLQDFFGDLFKNIGSGLKSFLSSTAGQISAMVGGVGLAISGLMKGGKAGAAMAIGGGAAAGAGIGAMIGGPAAPVTAAIGAAIGAAAGGLAVLVSKFTRRGKEKLEATKAAEELSRYVWQEVVPQVKAGLIGVEDGEKAIQAAFDAYQTYLHDNLKDQTVIARSIDTQRTTLTQGLAALDALKGELKGNEAIDILRDLGKQFLETGMMTDDFAKSITDAGGSVEFFNAATSQIQGLQDLRAEFGALKQAIDALLPKQKTWQEEFLDTGVITLDMAQKIRQAGGDIEQFKKFASMKQVKTEFESLIVEFNNTGVVSEKLLELIMEFGGPDSVASFRKLMAEAKASGKTIGDLANDSKDATGVIQGAFDSAGSGIDKAFTDAAKTLSDTLQEMDDNLGKAIASLQAAMVTMINDLIDVLLGVPGAAEKAARDANFFLGGIKDVQITIKTNLDASGIDELNRRLIELDPTALGQLGKFTDPPEGTTRTKQPQFSEGTPYVPFTGLAMVHQGERIIPANQNRGSGAVTINETVNFYNVNDPNEQHRNMQRLNREMLNGLRR